MTTPNRVLPWYRSLLCAAALIVPLPLEAASVFSGERQVAEVAAGVYVIRHIDPYPGWVHGNTTVIIGEQEVLVVDSCQLPSAAEEDIEQIRRWTDKPVRYLLNSHWHTDHFGGNHAYLRAFPALTIVAHHETRTMMDGASSTVAAIWSDQARQIRERLQQWAASGLGASGEPLTAADKAKIAERLAQADRIVADAKRFVYQPPTLTFDRELKIDLGKREVQILHLGRGNTIGDAVAYLPKERILITGDLLVLPVPYAYGGYPSEWIRTLETLARIDAQTIVPGHGEVLRDRGPLATVIDLMKSVVAQVGEQLRKNPEATLDSVKKSVDIESFRQRLAGDDPTNRGFFDDSMGSSFVELAYHEAKQR